MNTTYLFKSHVYAYNLFIQISVYVYNSFTQISRVWIQFIHSNLSVCIRNNSFKSQCMHQKPFILISVYEYNLFIQIACMYTNYSFKSQSRNTTNSFKSKCM